MRNKVAITIILAVVIIVAALVVSTFSLKPTPLSRASADFLIVISADGYNDSLGHGANGTNPWPVIHVQKGTAVNFTVYNSDRQAHGFQITHYDDSRIGTVAPGQRISVLFTANMTGTFSVYCSIFCTIHGFMQYGRLIVS